MKKRLLLAFLACCLSGLAWAEYPLKIVPLHHRFAQDLLPSLEPLAGPDGVINAIGTNLLIRAAPSRMAAIEQSIAMLDIERKMLRITVSRNRLNQASGFDAGVSGTIRRGNIEMQAPDRSGRIARGAVIELGRRDSSVDERSSEYVSVIEGERAVIAVGQSVPFTETWVTLTQRYARLQQSVQFRDITTGFAVRPRAIGDGYELEIAPRFASLQGGVIVFDELATTIRARAGEWVDVGGVMQSHDDVSREILSGGTASNRNASGCWIRVE